MERCDVCHKLYDDCKCAEYTEREKEMQDRERAIANREKGIGRAVKKLTKEEKLKLEAKAGIFDEQEEFEELKRKFV